MAMLRVLAVAAAVSVTQAAQMESRGNPIRKVVTMLQGMQEKVTAEGKKEQDLYDKFMCYCKTGVDDLAASIDAAETKVEELTASIEEAKKKYEQVAGNLDTDKQALADAKEAMDKATAIREKEAAEFDKETADLKTNVAALGKAIGALEKGAGGAFLQTSEANVIKNFAMEKANLADQTREELLSFLSGGDSDGYAPQSGEITGILKTMHDEMSKSLEESTTEETAAIANYDALIAAKTKESETLQAQIEEAMTRSGNLKIEIAESENDLEDTKEALVEDVKFLAELKSSCGTKTAEWEKIKAMRAEELVALADTIKILNDDDALDLFKKTLPSASSSFIQMTTTTSALKARALRIVKSASKKHPSVQLDLISLAINGKKVGFEKVLKMVDEMVANLKKEQAADDEKKEYCEKEMDKAEDKGKELDQSVADSETAIKEMQGAIETLIAETKALIAGVKALDKSVAEATEQRKEENTDYKELMQSDGMAKEILGYAKNRLNKFYNPKLYKAPAGEEEPASFVQIRAHAELNGDKAAPPPPPETFGPYTKKSEDSNGVIAMIDTLVRDLDKEMQEAEINEKESQDDYEKMMEDAASKRTADTKSITEKEGAKASTEESLEAEKDKKKATQMEAMENGKYLGSLHGECDWLLQNFDARKAARASESDALTQAKAVLNGADFSLIQTGGSRRVGFMAKRQ